jgi:hypothetical protein
MREEKELYRVLVGKPEGKRPLGRTRSEWEDEIRMEFKEIGCSVVWSKINWLRIGDGGGLL